MAFRSTCAARCTGRISCLVRQGCSCLRWEENKDTQTSWAENNFGHTQLKIWQLIKNLVSIVASFLSLPVKKKGKVQTYNHALERLQILTLSPPHTHTLTPHIYPHSPPTPSHTHTLTPHTPGPGPSEPTYLVLTHLLVVERNMAPPSCRPPWLGSGVLWAS